jgi:hypothetical protein
VLSITGRIVSKSLIKSGESSFGKWQIIQFVIEKTYAKKKMKIAFTAKGKWADFVNTLPHRERLRIEFFPDCFFYEKNAKYGTELRVISIEKWSPKKFMPVNIDGKTLNAIDPEISHEHQLNFNENEAENKVHDSEKGTEKKDVA